MSKPYAQTSGDGDGDGSRVRGPDDAGATYASTDRTRFDALILAGGKGRRLGGRDKGALVVAGTSMLQRALAAADGAERVIVSGHAGAPGGALLVQEDPPGGGPVAGIVAGLDLVVAPWVLVLAVDQPDAARAVPGLLAAAAQQPGSSAGSSPAQPGGAPAGAQADLLCHVDSGGYPQWLLGLYRTAALRAAAAGVGTGHGVSVRELTRELTVHRVLDGAAHTGDVDTWSDHSHWEARLRGN